MTSIQVWNDTSVRACFMQLCFSLSVFLSDIPLDMGVICCPEDGDLSRTRSSTRVRVRSSRATPPPKKNKVTVCLFALKLQ